ncbi:PAS domain S-box protein [uncultured Methanoregula sp.]|uniref:PAS domain S-box protein n=1 Tax=uncultured Methanoregula sp. TaxID=1005933 RepID=UPI002AAAC8CF|nr:PAS domain S-box protein [uncultured Methanoregula sp.]
MEEYQTEIGRIKELLSSHPEGLSITDIAGTLQLNRNSVAKYMDILQIQGAADGRKMGTAKIYYHSQRIPAFSLRKVCSRPLLVCNQDMIPTDVNQAFLSYAGIPSEQVLQKPFESVPVRFLEGGTSQQVLKKTLRGMEQRIRAQVQTGTKTLPCSLLLVPVVFENGKPGISIIIEDTVSSAEDSPAESASAGLLELLDDEIEYIVRYTPEGIIRYANEPYCRAVGKMREELIGRPFKPLVSSEDSQRIRAHLDRLSVQYPVGVIEYRAIMASGDLRYLRWHDRAQFNSRGEVAGYSSCGIDITDLVNAGQKLKKTQETLEETIVSRTEDLRTINRQLYEEIATREKMEEELLRTQFAMDHAAEMIFWVNRNARIQYANTTAIKSLGYTGPDIRDLPFEEIIPFYSLSSWDVTWGNLKNTGMVSTETLIVKTDGSRVPAEVTLTYLEYRGKEFVYCFSRDLTERTRMERALQEANKKLNIFTSIARHDIQNKITVLLGYLGRTKKMVTDPVVLDYIEKQETAAKAIRNEVNLTREFKDLGASPPEWQNVRQVLDTIIRQQDATTSRFTVDLPDIEIYADGQLDHVFERLFETSLPSDKTPPHIRIHSFQKERDLIAVIEYESSGIRPEDKEGIFEVQASKNRGLFMAREILSLTGIKLSETGEYGKNTRFEIGIPDTYFRYSK